jgi:hypothetical protein
VLAGCLPGSCASSLILEPDVGPETDARAQFFCPRRDVCLYRYAILTRRRRSPGPHLSGASVGAPVSDPVSHPSASPPMIKRSFLSLVQPFADGVIVRASARSAHGFSQARGNADARVPSRPSYCRPRPSPDGDHAPPGERQFMPLAPRIFQRSYLSAVQSSVLDNIWHSSGSIEND